MPAVLIVGAGPTGLTLACELARRGTAVRIIDKAQEFHRHSRGKTLNPRSLELLEDLGVGAEVAAAGTAHLVFRKYRDGRLISELDPFAGPGPTPDAPYDSHLFLPQWRVEDILRDRLAEFGVAVEAATELAGFIQDEDGVDALLTGGGRIRASYLVACDGGRSGIRKSLDVDFAGDTVDTQVMVCGDVEADGLDRDAWHQWFDDDGAVMLCPFPGTRAWQFQATPERDAEGRPVPPSVESFQRLFDRHARVPGVRLRNPTWLSTYRVNVRMADRLRVGRVFLAGDAAHVHSIAGGLGMNTGIQDAYNLGWKLALVTAGRAVPALLDTYEEERLPIAAWTLETSSERTSAVLAAIREPGGGTDTVVTPETRALALGYRWSSLSREYDHREYDHGEGGLRAGDRAPDAPCRDAAGGAPVRLFEMFAGPHFTLLGFGSASVPVLRAVVEEFGELVRACPVDAGPQGLADHAGHARAAYGVTEDSLVLVRPDNYLGLTAHATGGREVIEYLRRCVPGDHRALADHQA